MDLDQDIVRSLLQAAATQGAALAIFGMDAGVLASLVDKAQALIGVGKLAAGEALLMDLDDLIPTNVSIACLLADVRVRRGDLEGALKALSRTLARVSDDPSAAQLAHLERAQVWLALGEHALARADLHSAAQGPDARLGTFAHEALSLPGIR
jgi:predicted Zn-dependent protease